MPLPIPTPEQLLGIEIYKKEREERCRKVLLAWEKKKKKERDLSDKELKSLEAAEKIEKWKKADLTKK